MGNVANRYTVSVCAYIYGLCIHVYREKGAEGDREEGREKGTEKQREKEHK